MKRTTKLLALALALVLALGLAGCGAKTSSMTDSCYSERISSAPMEELRPDTPMESESMPVPPEVSAILPPRTAASMRKMSETRQPISLT